MMTQYHRFGGAAAILAAGALLAACSTKPKERSAEEGSGGSGRYSVSDADSKRDSAFPYGSGYESNPGMGGTGTMLLDTVYHGDATRNRSDSMNRDSSLIFPDAYPGTGAPGSRPEGGSGRGGTRDSLNLDRINDSLGVLDWHERG